MSLAIEDYALIGDCHTAALVGRDGSIDWLCLPRFDSDACFAALLGDPGNGCWRIAPASAVTSVSRRYRPGTLVLETEFQTAEGAIRVIDFMPIYNGRLDLVRIVEGVRGTVPMRMDLVVRFNYGSVVPWLRRQGTTLFATAGPHTLEFHMPMRMHREELTTVADFEVHAGERLHLVLNYRASHEPAQPVIEAESALSDTETHWRAWSGRSTYAGRWQEAVERSLITLKALTYAPTGGIVAAPTTSLPEQLGGVRNWDYRYCWLRDATFTLNALLLAGYQDEAIAWREWLLRAVAGSPQDMQILYGVAGERRLHEYELPWLAGYQGAAPVRVGNAASEQFQVDVYGEVMDSLHLARCAGLPPDAPSWRIQVALMRFLEDNWQRPDEGIWEVRGPRRHFTHSKVMAWVAFDRAVKAVERFGLEGPAARWRAVRDEIHTQVCERGYDRASNTFLQSYEPSGVDASLLLIPLVGFLPADDPRVRGTVEAVERELLVDGFVKRYATHHHVDGLPPGEGTFLPCSFWLADTLSLIGRHDEAVALFERLLAHCNDVGLYAEEWDPETQRHVGNFPQALTHMALINSARLLSLPRSADRQADRVGDRPGSAADHPPQEQGR